VRLGNPDQSVNISLKGAKSSWWCYRSRSSMTLRIDALRNQARRRRPDRKFQSSRDLDCSGVVTQHNWHKNTGIFNGFTNLKSIRFRVPIVCHATGCVSRYRDARYCVKIYAYPVIPDMNFKVSSFNLVLRRGWCPRTSQLQITSAVLETQPLAMFTVPNF
jgi:hypothetical protein